MLTVDRNIKYQQNLIGRQISIVVLIAGNNTRQALAPLIPKVEVLLPTIEMGRIYEIEDVAPPKKLAN